MKKMKFATLAMCLTMLVSCNLSNAVKGGGIGAVAGGLAGGVIGKLAGNTAVGAAVGAAVGGTTGALIGKHMDKVKARAAQVENAKVEEFTDANNLKAVKVTFDSGILFKTGKADLSADSKNALSKFAQVLIQDPQLSVEVQGHTDNTGSRATNERLSQQRAQSVSNYLTQCGVPYSQLKNIVGYAYDYPVADNNTAAGRAQNRRVDILLYASEAMINAAENGTLQ